MIEAFSMGTAAIPATLPGDPVEVVVELQKPMPTADFDVFILRSASIPLADLKITEKTHTHVTVTVTRPRGSTGTPGLHVFCTITRRGRVVEGVGKGEGHGLASGHGQAVKVKK